MSRGNSKKSTDFHHFAIGFPDSEPMTGSIARIAVEKRRNRWYVMVFNRNSTDLRIYKLWPISIPNWICSASSRRSRSPNRLRRARPGAAKTGAPGAAAALLRLPVVAESRCGGDAGSGALSQISGDGSRFLARRNRPQPKCGTHRGGRIV